MRKVYLIRHGETVLEGKKKRCIGRTDIPLNEHGKRQAEELGEWLSGHPVSHIFSSPLSRCRETAQRMAARKKVSEMARETVRETAGLTGSNIPVEVEEELTELDADLWENLEFEEIRQSFPELYEQRGRALGTTAPPGGESFLEGGIRLKKALKKLLSGTEGDLAVVTHSGVIRGLVCPLLGWNIDRVMEVPLAFGTITQLMVSEEDVFAISYKETGVKPLPYPDDEWCSRLAERMGLPERVLAHEAAVSRLAAGWADRLAALGWKGDPGLVRQAAFLHDIARLKPDHAKEGAGLLRKEGYPAVAYIIKGHHGLEDGEERKLTEASLVFLADKMMIGDRFVTLKERFYKSEVKCTTPEARESHGRQYRQALAVQACLRQALGVAQDENPPFLV